MMAYRNDFDAALDRITALEQENRRLTDELARMRGKPPRMSLADQWLKLRVTPADSWVVWLVVAFCVFVTTLSVFGPGQ